MRSSLQRGFTLVETAVTLAILAILLGGIAWTFAQHPGALARAGDGLDAALANARTIAATSGNGATLVFLPRTDGPRTLGGFSLRVFTGRPTRAGAVTPSAAMPLVSDAGVAERTFGDPPFSIFIGASGDVSGKAHYPALDARGGPRFDPIADEPPCPVAGFLLTLTDGARATATRSLPCASSVAGPRLPNPSPTPNVPLATPAHLQFHWPADARQRFVATEWGYTHWFATLDGLQCGDGVATFPNVLPSPYSPPHDEQEGLATPSPPPQTPYSYPNSGGGSMNDAPATFPLDAARAGLCSAGVADDHAQPVSVGVQVMGWLTAAFGTRSYTHLSKPPLLLPASTFPSKGASLRIVASKTFDAQALQPLVAFDAACAPYLSFTSQVGKTPPSPSPTPATATVTLTLVTIPESKVQCGGVIYDQYAGSLAGEGIAFNATLGTPSCPDSGNAWRGPADGACYDLYFVATGTTQTGGWTEESEMGLYAPHGTPGTSLYQWIVDSGTCYVQSTGGTGFAQWTVLLGNGDPTPPPVPSPQPLPNAAGFGVTYDPDAIAITSAPDPNPTHPPLLECGVHGRPSPAPPP